MHCVYAWALRGGGRQQSPDTCAEVKSYFGQLAAVTQHVNQRVFVHVT